MDATHTFNTIFPCHSWWDGKLEEPPSDGLLCGRPLTVRAGVRDVTRYAGVTRRCDWRVFSGPPKPRPPACLSPSCHPERLHQPGLRSQKCDCVRTSCSVRRLQLVVVVRRSVENSPPCQPRRPARAAPVSTGCFSVEVFVGRDSVASTEVRPIRQVVVSRVCMCVCVDSCRSCSP